MGWVVGAVVVAMVAIPVVLIMAVTFLGTSSQAKFEAVGTRTGADPNGNYDPNGGYDPGGVYDSEPVEPSPVTRPELGPLSEPLKVEGKVDFSLMVSTGWTMEHGFHTKGVHVQPGSEDDESVVRMIDGEDPYLTLTGPDGEHIYATWMPAVLPAADFARRYFPTSSAIPGKEVLETTTAGGPGVLVDESSDDRAFLLIDLEDGVLLLRLEQMPWASALRVVKTINVP